QYLIGHYAIQMVGAVVVPSNPMYKESQLQSFINEAEIKAAIAGQELYNKLENVTFKSSLLQFIITTHYTDFLIKDLTTHPLTDELKTAKKEIKETFDLLEIINTNYPITETEHINIWEDVGLMVF